MDKETKGTIMDKETKGTITVTLSNLYMQNGKRMMQVKEEIGGKLLDLYEAPYKYIHQVEHDMKCKYKGFKILVVREDS